MHQCAAPAGTPGKLDRRRITTLTRSFASASLRIDFSRSFASSALSPWRLQSQNGLTYVYAYVPTGAEPEQPAAVVVTLIDTSGNVATGLSLGSFTFDFTAPQR